MNEVHPLNPKTLEQKSTVPNVVVAVINQLIKKKGEASTVWEMCINQY